MSKPMKVLLAALMLLLGLMLLTRLSFGIEAPSAFSLSEHSSWRRYTWAWSSVPGAAKYRIKRSGIVKYETGSTQYTYYSTMLPGDTYVWAIVAVDPNGVESDETIVVYTAPEASESPIYGNRAINLALVKFPDFTDEPLNITEAQSLVDDVNAQFFDESYGQYNLTSTAEGWFTLSNPIDFYCDGEDTDPNSVNYGLWANCNDLLIGAEVLGMMQNPTPSFNWVVISGTSKVGSGRYISAQNGAKKYVLMHELGHNIGFIHSYRMNPPGDDDTFPVEVFNEGFLGYENGSWMGAAYLPEEQAHPGFSSLERYMVGWIPKEDTVVVQASTQLWLYDVEESSGLREVFIPVGSTPAVQGYGYTFEYKRSAGEVWPRLHAGITDFWYEFGLSPVEARMSLGGETFYDPYHGIYIEVIADEGVRVNLDINIQSGGGGGGGGHEPPIYVPPPPEP